MSCIGREIIVPQKSHESRDRDGGVSKATAVRLSSTAPPTTSEVVIFASLLVQGCRHLLCSLPLLSRRKTKYMIHSGARQTGSLVFMSPRDTESFPWNMERVAGEFGTLLGKLCERCSVVLAIDRAKYGGWTPIGWDRAGTCSKWRKEDANAGTMETTKADRNGTTDSPPSLASCFCSGCLTHQPAKPSHTGWDFQKLIESFSADRPRPTQHQGQRNRPRPRSVDSVGCLLAV